MGTNPALGGNQPAAAQGHGFAQGLAAFRSEAGRWADKGPGCSSVVGQLPTSAHQAEHHLPDVSGLDCPSVFPGTMQRATCTHYSGPSGKLFRFAGLAPATRQGASVHHMLLFLPAVSCFTFSQTFCLFSVSRCVLVGVRLKSLVPGG